MTALQQFIDEVRIEVDRALDRLVPAEDIEPRRLHEAIRWSLFGSGKRIRPAIVFAAGKTFGAAPDQLIHTAAAIEMIHTYSLIHDDLPSMDDDDLRRGRATCHKQFGEATAILAGDVLQTLAFKTVAEDDSLAPDVRLKLISGIASASGTPQGMVAGQQLDVDAEGKQVSIAELEQIHSRKTGALISAAAASGAIIGGAADDELEAINRYAAKLGLLFQITDDLLDVTQGTEKLGKTAGKDAVAEKATYPSLYGVEEAREMANTIRDQAIGALATIPRDTTLLASFVDLVLGREK
jgi:geranylgeranyl pyrophosphate synthase